MIFTAGPWHPDWGDQDHPRHVANIKVAKSLLRREGGGGALVILTDRALCPNRFHLRRRHRTRCDAGCALKISHGFCR